MTPDAQATIRGQRRRVKGWTMPPEAVYVGRPTRWGNPWRIKQAGGSFTVVHDPSVGPSLGTVGRYATQEDAAAHAVHAYREHLAQQDGQWISELIQPLAGRTLMCWCAPKMPCHVDVLVEYAAHSGLQVSSAQPGSSTPHGGAAGLHLREGIGALIRRGQCQSPPP